MDLDYTLISHKREAKPRSKRLRGLGGNSGFSGGSTIVSATAGDGNAAVAGSNHTHANKVALDQISTDDNGYLLLSKLAEIPNEETGETEMQAVSEKVKAGYADLANDLTDDGPAAKRFLSSIADDIAEGRITFKEGLTTIGLAIFRDGAHFGEFIKSLYAGKGAGIDKDGNAEFQTIRVRGCIEAMEYIVNRLSAIEGDQLLTESDTVDRVVDNSDGTFDLYLRSKWAGYFTAQVENNVLKGIINTMSAGGGYCTCWLRINSVDRASNRIVVTMYPDSEVPGGKNYPPCELMKVARWGNQTDTERQSCLYLSSTEGRIVKLSGVTKPIIDSTNYGATFGSVPEFLKEMGLPLIDGQDYVYVRGLIAQDIVRIDYNGRPVITFVDRGEWDAEADYYNEAVNPDTGIYETSDVWYKGCKYRCMATGTHTAPAWYNTAWAMIEGNPDFTVEFAEVDSIFDPDDFSATLSIIAKLHNIDITDDITDGDVIWSRYTEDADGNQRTELDEVWNNGGTKTGKVLRLTADDIDFDGDVPGTARFSATVKLRNSSGQLVAQAEV